MLKKQDWGYNLKLKAAILDMYKGFPNQGMGNIKGILTKGDVDWNVYDIRVKSEVPKLSNYDLIVSTGGPDSPYEGQDTWQKLYGNLLDELIEYNQNNSKKKYAFLICHSFQMAVTHFELGHIKERNSTAFGIFPVHKTDFANRMELFKDLRSPIFAVDSRDWQMVEPNALRFQEMDAKILFLEKIRPNVKKERAVMGIQFTPEIIGTQFHPEADAKGMKYYFSQEEKMEGIIKAHGYKKYTRVMSRLEHEDKLPYTQDNFIPKLISQIKKEYSYD